MDPQPDGPETPRPEPPAANIDKMDDEEDKTKVEDDQEDDLGDEDDKKHKENEKKHNILAEENTGNKKPRTLRYQASAPL